MPQKAQSQNICDKSLSARDQLLLTINWRHKTDSIACVKNTIKDSKIHSNVLFKLKLKNPRMSVKLEIKLLGILIFIKSNLLKLSQGKNENYLQEIIDKTGCDCDVNFCLFI